MKILFVINSLSSGGAERQCVNLANGFYLNGNNVTLIVLSARNEKKRFYLHLINNGISIRVFKIRLKLLIPIIFALEVWKLRPDIVYNLLETANLLGSIIPRLLLGRLVTIANSIRGPEKINFKYIFFWRRFCDIVLCNSNYAKKYLIENFKYPINRVHVIYNPILINLNLIKSNHLYIKIDNEELNIIEKKIAVCIGRITPIKNQLELLRVWKNISYQDRNILLLIGNVQNRPYYNKLCEYLKENSIKNVRFSGEISKIETYYKIADLLIQTSLGESLPNVIIEGIGYKIPIIASDVGDTKEILSKYGYFYKLYTCGDEKRLYHSIERMLNTSKKLVFDEIAQNKYDLFLNDFSIEHRIYETEMILKNSIKMRLNNENTETQPFKM
jgi:glycosyltransferase involved in cell wall biosynthesis